MTSGHAWRRACHRLTLIRMAFDDANNYMKNGTLMRQVINKINGIDFNLYGSNSPPLGALVNEDDKQIPRGLPQGDLSPPMIAICSAIFTRSF